MVNLLPKGRLLPDDAWEQRHRWIVALLAAHAVGIGLFALGRGLGLAHSLLEASLPAAAALLASAPGRGRLFRSSCASLGLITCSALVVHLWDGQIEGHFHFFVIVAVLTLYQDWLPFLLAIVYVVVHHGAVGVLAPASVYTHAGQMDPWLWAAIHGGFVLAASAANVVAWRVNEQLLHEPLTGLPGRAVFLHAVERALARAGRGGDRTAVLFLDLDRFKVVNDSLGHGAGDRLLVEVAARIKATVRKSDFVARLGGDEFAVLSERLRSDEEAVLLAERIDAALQQSFVLMGVEVTPAASIGISLAHEGTQTSEDLIAEADVAMYRAKASRSDRLVVLSQETVRQERDLLRTERDLRSALERDELHVVYQPIVSLRDEVVVGAEALVRWQHPERGLLAPREFIPIAEESGLIHQIGRWVLERACCEAADWPQAGGRPAPYVSVNLSGRQCADPLLVDIVGAALHRSNLEPGRLALELTESALVDERVAAETLETLSALGVRVVLDDFGTGYSSLAHVDRLPIEALKVDRSFIQSAGKGGRHDIVLNAIAAMARALGLAVVAEGVETEAQARALRLLGIGYAQGFLFARPQPAHELRALLEADEPPLQEARAAAL